MLWICVVAAMSVSCQKIEPVDYVNPNMGNISHLLVPTYPTVHLPNGMMRVYPERADFTTDYLTGLPLIVAEHRRGASAGFVPYTGDLKAYRSPHHLTYDGEQVRPYRYSVWLDGEDVEVDYAPSTQSALYVLRNCSRQPLSLLFPARDGEVAFRGNAVSGWRKINGRPHKVYFHVEFETAPQQGGLLKNGKPDEEQCVATAGRNLVVVFSPENPTVRLRYGVSFISGEQARRNLRREIEDYDIESLALEGRRQWNEVLGKIDIDGADDAAKSVFYTSLYRAYERPVCISEDGKYYSAFDGRVHEDGGRDFYVDDWLWDTYRATHPLRVLIDPEKEDDMLHSLLAMTDHMPRHQQWLPTFPQVTGDSRGMNCNHGVISLYDAWVKGCRDFDPEKAFRVSRAALEEKTLIPWKATPSGVLDRFYREKGYFPALAQGEKETVAEVNPFEKRQAVAVTLGTSYDHWALSGLARVAGNDDLAAHYRTTALNYRNLFHPATRFFHPRTADGQFVADLDYCTGGGVGGRDYYDENNAYTYRWDVAHNIHDLVRLHGGAEAFDKALDSLFSTPLGMSRPAFFKIFGSNQTGNVGQFGMGNEPSFHIPYLYVYCGKAWKTQKRVRSLLDMWFRNDLMGVPGDEDGGGMSAFVVFSQMGFYPVTPGTPLYCLGTPSFSSVRIRLTNGNTFSIEAKHLSRENKYIQRAKLNGKEYDRAWLLHSDIVQGGKLELEMGPRPNKEWGREVPVSYFDGE